MKIHKLIATFWTIWFLIVYFTHRPVEVLIFGLVLGSLGIYALFHEGQKS